VEAKNIAIATDEEIESKDRDHKKKIKRAFFELGTVFNSVHFLKSSYTVVRVFNI